MTDAERIAEIRARHEDARGSKLGGSRGLTFAEWHKYMAEDIPFLLSRLESALRVVGEIREHNEKIRWCIRNGAVEAKAPHGELIGYTTEWGVTDTQTAWDHTQEIEDAIAPHDGGGGK